jgi:protocatechuate 3,4-dioxygenase alpha subunit
MTLEPTASQTVGPYLHIGLCALNISQIAMPGCPGEHVTISGLVLDADGIGVNDALVEIWQADSQGRYVHPEDTREGAMTPGFRGFGRMPTDADGHFAFLTIKPGPVPDQHGGMQAPHLLVSVFMRGLLKRLVSRIYFPDEPLNAKDSVLQLVPPERRMTLVARRAGAGVLEWNVMLQGTGETVFFDC